MADFTALKASIQQYIKQNGQEEITGNILQEVLLSMVSTMGDGAINDLQTALTTEVTNRQNADGTLQGSIESEVVTRGAADTALGGRIDGVVSTVTAINTKLAEGYVYAGLATTSTNPSTPTGKVFYIATVAGTYTNFSGVVLTYGINILKYNGSEWSSEQVIAIDDVPTAESDNLVKSGGVKLYTDKGTTQAENDTLKTYIGKPHLTYGRLDTNISTSDGYTVTTPVNKSYAHSQIMTNVLSINPNGRNIACLVYDKNGVLEEVLAGSTNERSFARKSVRIHLGLNSEEEDLQTVANSITIISCSEQSIMDKVELIGSERLFFYQGNVQQNLVALNNQNYCHSCVLNNVKSITPASGYQIAVIGLDADGSYSGLPHPYQWESSTVVIPNGVESVVFNIRKSDTTFLSADTVNSNVGNYVTVVRKTRVENNFELLTRSGFIKRNIKTTYYGINNTGNVAIEQNNRIHSGFIDNCIGIFCNSGYEIAPVCFDENGNRVETYYSWQTNVLFDKKYRVRFNIRKAGDNTDFTAEQKTAAEENVFVYTSTKFFNQKISILGDSLSTFNDNTESVYSQGTWTYAGNRCFYPKLDGDQRFIRDIDKMWFKRVLDNFGFEMGINESWAGTTISNVRSENLVSSQTRINHLGLNGTPDIIVIYAGTNDINENVTVGTLNTEDPYDYTDDEIAALPVITLADAYRTMLIRVQKTYQTSKIVAILPDHEFWENETLLNSKRIDCINMIKDVCTLFGVPYISMRNLGVTTFNKTGYIPDWIHLNIEGAELVYRKVYNFMQNYQ